MQEEFNIALAGFGVVGSGLARLIQENADVIRARCGRKIAIRTILVRDLAKKRDAAFPAGCHLTADPADFLNVAGLDAVVELIGGTDLAGQIVRQALERDLEVVTANKALLAEQGMQLFELARRNQRILHYEASVAGAIPVVGILRDSITGNRVSALTGILNGTSNYILSEMTAENLEFEVALGQAQKFGYAEADPGLDIDGLDAAHKLVLLIRLAFGRDYPLECLQVEGIREIKALDIRLAREFGYRVKLIGQVNALGEQTDPVLAAGVFPALVQENSLLARVSGPYNAIHVDANAAGPLFFHGRGAGSLPTAGAVLADLIAIARGGAGPNTGFARDDLQTAKILPADDCRARYYVRAIVADTPGVLRDLSGCMAAEGISVAQMIQKGEAGGKGVPLVFMTHETTEKAMRLALNRVMALGFVGERPLRMRVL